MNVLNIQPLIPFVGGKIIIHTIMAIQRKDLGLNIILRVYESDLEQMETRKAPKVMKI